MNQELLHVIVSKSVSHAKWLNTFSYLEYIGFRKIVKSQPSSRMNFALLSHAIEEGRHALRLKKLAVKIGGEAFESYSEETMICSKEAAVYFQMLDRSCAKILNSENDSWLSYLYVTWLVELRAIDIYRIYAEVSESSSLQSLIGEETNHLLEVRHQLASADPHFLTNSQELLVEEGLLYEQFCSALRREVLSA